MEGLGFSLDSRWCIKPPWRTVPLPFLCVFDTGRHLPHHVEELRNQTGAESEGEDEVLQIPPGSSSRSSAGPQTYPEHSCPTPWHTIVSDPGNPHFHDAAGPDTFPGAGCSR